MRPEISKKGHYRQRYVRRKQQRHIQWTTGYNERRQPNRVSGNLDSLRLDRSSLFAHVQGMVEWVLLVQSWVSDMKEFCFTLAISVDEFMTYYQGIARNVITISEEGTTVQFPAYVLRSYLTDRGIYGDFVLQCDEHNKFKGIRKVE